MAIAEASGRYVTSDDDIRACLARVHHIALIGISLKPERASYQVMGFLLTHGFEVSPVNPGLASQLVWGQHIFSALSDITTPIDMVDVFRQPAALDSVVDMMIEGAEPIASDLKAAASCHVPVLWTQLGVIRRAATDRAVAAGISVIEDRCPAQDIPRWQAAGKWPTGTPKALTPSATP